MFVYPESYVLTKEGFIKAKDLDTSFTLKTYTNNNILVTKSKFTKVKQTVEFVQFLLSTGVSLTLPLTATLKNGTKVSNIAEGFDFTVALSKFLWSGKKTKLEKDKKNPMPRQLQRIVESHKGISQTEFYGNLGSATANVISGAKENKTETIVITPQQLLQYSSADLELFFQGFFKKSNSVEIKDIRFKEVQNLFQMVAISLNKTITIDSHIHLNNPQTPLMVKEIQLVSSAEAYDLNVSSVVVNGIGLISTTETSGKGFGNSVH